MDICFYLRNGPMNYTTIDSSKQKQFNKTRNPEKNRGIKNKKLDRVERCRGGETRRPSQSGTGVSPWQPVWAAGTEGTKRRGKTPQRDGENFGRNRKQCNCRHPTDATLQQQRRILITPC